MFGNNFTLFRLFGFHVRANVSWLFLAILVTWSLASGFFPAFFPDLSTGTYWILGLAGMVGLFFSLLFHEFSHALVARARGLPMGGITLFLFGGVAEMEMEPPNPKTEFWMAIAGPIASVLLAFVFYAVAAGMQAAGTPEYIAAVPHYLAMINLLLAAFNMLPGFPLDGGRVLRAALWAWRNNLRWATKLASHIGQGIGIALMAIGALNAVSGNFVGGIWWVLIGLFLQGAASAGYQRLLQQEGLKGETVSRFMSRDPVTAPGDTTIRSFVDDYLYEYGHDMVPIVRDSRLVGCATVKDVKQVPREDWGTRRIEEVVDGCSDANTISPDTPADAALQRMQEGQRGRLMVVEDGNRLAGVLTLKDLLRRLSMKSQLEGSD